MTDADQLALVSATRAVHEQSAAARRRILEEAQRGGQDVLTDAQQAEFLRATKLTESLNDKHWKPPTWPCEVHSSKPKGS